MIEHRPFLALGVLRRGGVDARRHFREGVDSALPGPLYGWDDVEFAPHSGLGMQVHRDVEIVTWVRSGAITHEDDAGNRVRLVADSVHVTSAGAAFHHAERNEENVPARQFRIWLRPRTPAGTARCATRVCSPGCRDGRFVTVASGDPDDVRAGALPLHADARVRIAMLREGTTMQHGLPLPGAAYLVADHGRLDVGPIRLAQRDGIAVRDETWLALRARDDTKVVIVERLRQGRRADR